MTETRLSYGELLTDIIRTGILPTGVSGRPTAFGYEPRIYCSTDEAVIASSARLLQSQGFRLILRSTRVLAPNFYSILFGRQIDEEDANSESESFELRLVREGGNPLQLALVGSQGRHKFWFNEPETVYLPGTVIADHMTSRFTSMHPGYNWRWMPVFDDFVLS